MNDPEWEPKISDRVEVRHVFNPFAHKRFTNIPDTVTWHSGTIWSIQGKEFKVKLDKPFKGFESPVVSRDSLRIKIA